MDIFLPSGPTHGLISIDADRLTIEKRLLDSDQPLILDFDVPTAVPLSVWASASLMDESWASQL
jgi:hypothetical protein